MALGKMLKGAVNDLKSNLLDSLTGAAPALAEPQDEFNSAEGAFNEEFSDEGASRKIWKIDGQNWHKVMGYRFSITKFPAQVDVGPPAPVSKMHFTLPIPPQSISIKPVIPSAATATFGGVVEETSAVKFWMISMSGTTGTAVGRQGGSEGGVPNGERLERKELAKEFRDVMETTGLLAGAKASADRTISKIGGIADRAIDGFGNISQNAQDGNLLGGIGAAVGTVTGAINDLLLPPLPYSGSSVRADSNGFVEAEELQRFFYMYNAIKSKNPNKYALYFTNYKTDQVWRCIVKDFTLQRSSENPNLIRYNMVLQGWDVQNVSSFFSDDGVVEFDRFGPGGDLAPVNVLNAGDKNVLDTAKSVVRDFFNLGDNAAPIGGGLL